MVTVASTSHGINPVRLASRYSRAKKKINVPRPNLITQYNRYMGGPDQTDVNIGNYRIGISGKNDGGLFSLG